MKIVALILTVLYQLVAAVIGLFLLLIVLNGYSERDAAPGLILYIVLNLATALGFGVASRFVINRLMQKTSMGSFGASSLVTVGFWIVGTVILVALFAACVLIAEVQRTR